MKKLSLKVAAAALVVTTVVLVAACSQDAISKTNFVFKPQSNGNVAKIGDKVISEKEFNAGIESDLYEAEMKVYEIKMAKLKSMALQHFIDADPKKGTKSNDEYLDSEIAKDIKISDKDVQKFITDRQIPKEQINDDIKQKITEYLQVEAKKEAIEKWLANKTQKSPIEVYFNKPELPVFKVEVGDAPVKGNPSAKVTIVEYSDFQCPFCSKAATTVNEIAKKYGNKVQIAFKHYPLPFHAQAKIASQASMCAYEQKKEAFWTMHDKMFADQSKLDQDSLINTAKAAGLKVEDFKNCLTSQKYVPFIEKNVAEGQQLGVKSTPTFFINGKLLAGALPVEAFSEVIDEELAK